ncbi:AraC family transcriptional regulator [Olivibacter ginsenosidimutans]
MRDGIFFQLGYDDYPYFSRLFTKIVGMTALSFRQKNRD